MKVEKAKVLEVIHKLRELYREDPFICVSCKSVLPFKIQDAWPHDKNFAWLYIECQNCHYQNALWKILRSRLGPE